MTNAQIPDLFSPFSLGPLMLKNRMIMAPLTRNRAGPGNVPQALNVEYYAQRASAGLIISEGAQVSPVGQGYPATPGIHSAEQIEGWQQVTAAVHERGGLIFLQLWHVGRISHPSLLPQGILPVAPSAVLPAGEAFTEEGMKPFVMPRSLASDEIAGIIEEYRQAARNAQQAGFDGVEIHAANGYLIDQFLRDGTNLRNDRYGGGLENRCRFLLEVTEAVVEVWGADRVGVRLSPVQPFNDMRDSNPQALFSYVAAALNAFDLVYLHVTEMGRDAPGLAGPFFEPGLLRGVWKGIYMTNSGYDRQRAIAAVAEGDADLVAFGVPFIANPDLVERFRRDAPLNLADPDSFYGGGAQGYTDYPFLED
ncbi:MAG: alkene reductase [Methylococcaceae bacterium]|nr:alkene reductase [Methylococcaceae bacterium]